MKYVILLLLFYITSTSGFKTAANPWVTCSLDDGAVHCWGENYKGLLGIGDTDETTVHTTPQQVYASGVVDLACTYNGACCAIKDGTIYCWGSGVDYMTGLNTADTKYSPTQAENAGYDMIGCGVNACIARKSSNKGWVGWGGGYSRMLGPGTDDDKTPKYDCGLPQLKMEDFVVVGFGVVATDSSGDVWGWGKDSHSGWGGTGYETCPKKFNSIVSSMRHCVSFIKSGNGGMDTGYCKDSSGDVWAWGNTVSLRLVGPSHSFSYTDYTVAKLITYTTNKAASGEVDDGWDNVKEIAVNDDTIYILTTDGKIYFGGDASGGYTATETISWSSITSAVELDAWGSNNDHVGVAGEKGFIVKKTDGTKWSIGNNAKGQLGTTDQLTDTTYPFSIKQHDPPPRCALNEYGNNGVCTACGANTVAKTVGDLQSCTNCTCECPVNYYGNNGACTACASAYRNPAGDDQACTTCSCTKLPDCALNEYANGDGCTACGANAVNKTVGDDPATVTICTCPLNYYGNNGVCTQCTGSDIEITENSGFTVDTPDQSLSREQCKDYAENRASTSWEGDVDANDASSYPSGCSLNIAVPQKIYWNPSTTSSFKCSFMNVCVEGAFTATAGTRSAGDNQACTTCSCDAPCQKGEYGNGAGCTACGANALRQMGDLQTCTNCTCTCPLNYFGDDGSCTACASAYRNPSGEDQSCTTCSCTKLADCALNEYANGDGCTACGANALNEAGDDPATVTTCTCPLNYFGNSGACTKCEPSSIGFVEISDGSAPTIAATKTQCEHYADITDQRSWMGEVTSSLQSFQPDGCITAGTNLVYWNPNTGGTEVCGGSYACVDLTTNPYVGTRLVGDDQSCTTCACDAPCGIGNYGDNYGCTACAANTQAKAAGDLQSCTTCACLCDANHYGNNGSCTACANGYENAAGDQQQCTTCACSAKPPCQANEYGNGNGCTACAANTVPKDAGDSQDCTVCSCQCQANFFGDDGLCTACSTGYSRGEGDNPACTTCACETCVVNYYGDTNSCQQCPGNSTNPAGDDITCTDCSCKCGENLYGNFGVCTACPDHSTNAAGDSHGCQTCSCTCDENYYGVNSSCVACDSGYTNPAGDLPSCQNCSCTEPPPLPEETSTGTSLHFNFIVWILSMVVFIMV